MKLCYKLLKLHELRRLEFAREVQKFFFLARQILMLDVCYYYQMEVMASRHKDDNSVACIVDKCYVLSYPEYCRYCNKDFKKPRWQGQRKRHLKI